MWPPEGRDRPAWAGNGHAGPAGVRGPGRGEGTGMCRTAENPCLTAFSVYRKGPEVQEKLKVT
ncbi:hypothetical protein DGo_CA0531 [Deinococcus gobiensis I-0]|uniref:Uncharacterized protein n=1 Tax=Deinococcus gobiensis (strain DSM 21396 / JCM 16679 / CGMCC 1.7299 / I-0) TaxID=745776 RepID=H8GWI8_DEIGI|nr:hypothetical protein DGo_CA0531 [Deinococcus gobiensis I-0]